MSHFTFSHNSCNFLFCGNFWFGFSSFPQHINRFYLFASVAIIILPCNLASAQDEPNPLLQVGDNDDGIALTERLPTASTFDDLTTMADSADFVPMELYNVSYFEEVVWPIFIGDFSNDSDELLCSARNHTEHLVDFTSGGLGK